MTMRMHAWWTLFVLTLVLPQSRAGNAWNGFERKEFIFDRHLAFVTIPRVAAAGKPWIWRTSFPDFHPEVDIELLNHGWYVAYVDCVDMLGCDAALDIFDGFYESLRSEYGLAEKPALEAVSRGGLSAYRYAARRPERIACIYADTPVMQLASWPLSWPGASKEVADALRAFGFDDVAALRAYRGNPVDSNVLEPIARAGIPLRHVISLDDEVVPPEANTLEARRRLEKLGHVMEIVSVEHGTKESNGHHFELPAVFDSARFVMRWTTVLPRAAKPVEYDSLRDGLQNCRSRFMTDKVGRVAFVGGSITFNPGWRDAVMHCIQQHFPDTKFEFVAAGIPSLGSVPHAFRLEKDVLSHGIPDLVFVEAAVNDHNYDELPNRKELALRGMEGVVRHLRTSSPATDIVMLHFVHDQHLPIYGQGEQPYTIEAHERVAAQYGCPSVQLSREVYERIRAGQFTWAADFRDLHPSPFGQQLYANGIARLLDAAWTGGSPTRKDHPLPAPVDPLSYGRGRFGDLAAAKLNGFVLDPRFEPKDGKETREGFVRVPALVAEVPGAAFEFDFRGTAAGLLLAAGPDTGIIEFRVDTGAWRRVDTRTPWSASLHLPWALILDDELPDADHVVAVRLTSERPNSALRVIQLLEN